MPYVENIHPLVGPAEGDGDLGPWAIARVGGGVFRSDGEHPLCGELPFSSTLGRGEAPEDGGDHLIVVLESIVVAPQVVGDLQLRRWRRRLAFCPKTP